MKTRNRVGLLSLICGALSFALVRGAAYLGSVYGDGSLVTRLFGDDANTPRQTLDVETTISAPGILSITDEKLVFLIFCLAGVLAAGAIALSLLAERKGESSSLLGAGFICAGMTFVTLHLQSGALVAFVAFIALLLIRKHRLIENAPQA